VCELLGWFLWRIWLILDVRRAKFRFLRGLHHEGNIIRETAKWLKNLNEIAKRLWVVADGG